MSIYNVPAGLVSPGPLLGLQGFRQAENYKISFSATAARYGMYGAKISDASEYVSISFPDIPDDRLQKAEEGVQEILGSSRFSRHKDIRVEQSLGLYIKMSRDTYEQIFGRINVLELVSPPDVLNKIPGTRNLGAVDSATVDLRRGTVTLAYPKAQSDAWDKVKAWQKVPDSSVPYSKTDIILNDKNHQAIMSIKLYEKASGMSMPLGSLQR